MTSEDKTKEIPCRHKPTEQLANNAYFIEYQMRSGKKSQNVFLIKCQNLPHSESNWEPEQNIFLKEINLFYFKESSVKRTHYDTMFNLIDEITIQSKNTSRLGNIL